MSHSLRQVSLAAAILAASMGAHAQNAQPQQLERIEITGSAIKRSIADEGALPISVIKAEELRQSGVTSVEQIIDLLASSQSSNTGSNSIGSSTGGAARQHLLRGGVKLAAFSSSVSVRGRCTTQM